MVSMEANKAAWNPESLTGIANKLCMEAFRRGSMDNITGMSLFHLVIFFFRRSSMDNVTSRSLLTLSFDTL